MACIRLPFAIVVATVRPNHAFNPDAPRRPLRGRPSSRRLTWSVRDLPLGAKLLADSTGARLSKTHAVKTARLVAYYSAGVITICFIFWLLVETKVIEFVGTITIGHTESSARYFRIDPSTKRTRGGYVLMETILSFRNPQPNPGDPAKPYSSIKAIGVYDCANRTMGMMDGILYSGESARGDVLKDAEPMQLDQVELKPIIRGSAGEGLIHFACTDVSRARIWWALLKATAIGGKLDLP